MKFSICIPNYNYDKYIGRTLKSVLDQNAELEVLVSDNCSTDRSLEVVRAFEDPRVLVHVNQCNVGFAHNLDKAARMATGEVMIMLSSDDLIRPGALEAYAALYAEIDAERAIVTAACDKIDPDDKVTGYIGPNRELFTEADLVTGLPVPAGAKLYKVEGAELLRRCLRTMKNPFNFMATSYARALYEKVEGYGGGRTISPDKWFHWRILGAGAVAYFIDAPLFAYRWHPNNQSAIQAATGALKHMADEYLSTFELDKATLERIGLTREDVERAFIERDVGRHGLATLARGNRMKAERIYYFGKASYPEHARHNKKMWALGTLLKMGPLGARLAKLAYDAKSE